MMIGFTTRMTIQKHDILPAEEAAIIQGRSFFVAAYIRCNKACTSKKFLTYSFY